jgi:hypothetical protein
MDIPRWARSKGDPVRLSEGTLYSVDAPYLTAGVVAADNGIIVATAPILNYMRHWSIERVALYCQERGWKCKEVSRSS